MINLRIGTNTRNFNSINEIDESWISRQIVGLKDNRLPLCIRVSIQEGSVNLLLATQGCVDSGGGSRVPNRDESKVFELWREMKLDGEDFHPGKFIAFFKRVRNFIS
jgi:hypothetical protein